MSQDASIVALDPGQRLAGGYTVENAISSGAMGAVYRARDGNGLDVAIKRLMDPRERTRFEIEARLLARLHHPRVVNVISHFEDESGIYLVMELIIGVDLGTLLRQRGAPGIPVTEAIGYTLQACEALQYVHEQNVLHRDVKPQNMVLAETGLVLVDFGVAREISDEVSATRAIGTPQFMAPEILAGEGVSPRSDVYGLAATLWTLISGKPPAYQDQTPLAKRFEGVTTELEETLRSGLALHPERRLASAAALASALGSPLGVSAGRSLALSVAGPAKERGMLEAIVRTAAGVFEAAASSIALTDQVTGELVYQAAWGAGAEEIAGVRLPAGEGVAGSVVAGGESVAVPECRRDPHFSERIAEGTGYVPNTMLVALLQSDGQSIGALSVLDQRDGKPYGPADMPKAQLFAELAVAAIGR